MPLPLTVLIITHRSDQRLGQALASVDFADEILIIDNHSQQDWSKYSLLPLKVIKYDQPLTDFSAVKNQFSKLAKNEWLLFLDSDEVVTPALADEIKKAVGQNQISGFYIQRVDYFYQQPLHYGEVGQIWLLRLAKKEAVRFERPVHEVAQVNGQTQRLKNPLHHYAHESLTEFYQKVISYAELEAAHRYQQGHKFSRTEMIIYPLAKFKWNYCFKLGCLDGYRGLIYAVMMSLHSFLVRVRLYELTHKLNGKT